MRPSMFDEDDTDDSPSLLQRTVFRPRVGLSQAVVDPVSLGLDASVLDYDGFVEKKNEAASISGAGKGIGGQARYIGGLVAKAEERKKVLEEVHERKLAREREAEGALYSDKEVFVTSSYAATLELRKLEAEKEAKTALADEAAASKAGMSGIFKSMLFGGGAIGDSALACSISGGERARIPLAPYTSSEKSLAPPLVPHNHSHGLSAESASQRVTLPEPPQQDVFLPPTEQPLSSKSDQLSTKITPPARFQGSTPAQVGESRALALERFNARAAAKLL